MMSYISIKYINRAILANLQHKQLTLAIIALPATHSFPVPPKFELIYLNACWIMHQAPSANQGMLKQPRPQGPLSTSRKHPGYGWSRVHACQP